MDPAQYYITTLSKAASTMGPFILYAIGGYIIFIKLPFWLALKTHKENRSQNNEEKPSEKAPVSPQHEKVKLEKPKSDKKDGPKEKINQENKKTDDKKSYSKKSSNKTLDAYEVFELRSDEKFTKSELKKKYYELLRQNHPDKVASLGSDLKKLAEKKTKDINSAYEELKKKAS